MMKNICVFLGASNSTDLEYERNVIALANEFAKKNLGLVYGAASIGLMGRLASTAIESGCKVTGVITKKLAETEITQKNLTHLHIVNSMQERKLMMAEISDAFVMLPGGVGTLEEFFEIWNAVKIGLYKKPIGILNINGYYDQLFSFLENAQKEGFVKKEHLALFVTSDCPITLINSIHSILSENN